VRYTWSPTTFDLALEYPDGYLFSQGIISLLSVGFLASLAISVVALTVFVNIIVQERKTEYAIMRAMGGTRRQVTAIVLGEFVGLILAAFLFSMLMGIVFSQVLMQTILQLFPQPYVIPFTIIYPISLLAAVLGLVVLGLIAGAYLPARRAGKIEVSTILRNL
jgi:putative ABC transport system permease protein